MQVTTTVASYALFKCAKHVTNQLFKIYFAMVIKKPTLNF